MGYVLGEEKNIRKKEDEEVTVLDKVKEDLVSEMDRLSTIIREIDRVQSSETVTLRIEVEPGENGETAPKRGRPRGSKNKAKK